MANSNLLDSLVLSEASRQQLDNYLAKPSHALMLTGLDGVGLGTVAKALARQLAGADVVYIQPTQHNKQKTTIINADDVADLATILRDRRDHPLAIVLDGADQTVNGVFERMLKLIEEPVVGVHYIFTAHNLSVIPATILSRSSLIKLTLPNSSACSNLYDGLELRMANQIKFIADRRPALICRLINDQEYFAEQVRVVELAKQFIGGSRSHRIQCVDAVSDKEQAIHLCQAIEQLLEHLLARQSSADMVAVSRRLGLVSLTADRLSNNGNVRIQLINLAINF